MSKDELIVFYAMHHADSVPTDSFCCLVEKGQAGGYGLKHWFGNKFCSYSKANQHGNIIHVSAPRWLLEKKGIIDLIAKV